MSKVQGQQLIHVGVSQAFENKNLRADAPYRRKEVALGYSYKPSTITRAAFVQHVLSGNAWTPGYFKGKTRRNNTFQFAELIALDADDGLTIAEALNHPIIRQYATLIHPSPSSSAELHKTRIVFVLDQPVEGSERYRALVGALITELGMKFDPASSKPAQPYYGSTNRVEQPYVNLDTTLPLAVLAELTYDTALADMLRETAPKLLTVRPTGTRAEAYASATLERELARLASAPTGERNNTLYSVARRLFSYALGGWQGITETGVQAELEAIVSQWDNLRKSLSTIKSAHKQATPKPLELPEKPCTERSTPRPFELPTVDADLTVNLRYISETPAEILPTEGALIVRSPIGTGKTRLAARVIARASAMLGHSARVLVVTHRQALAQDLTDRLNAEGQHFECYKGLNSADLRRIDRLVICANSLPKLATVGAALPAYDVLIIDESEQVLEHFGGRTFRKHEAITAHEVLCALVTRAGSIVAMDAHAGSVTRDWLIEAGKSTRLLNNTHVVERGTLTLHDSVEALVARANALIDENTGVIALPVGSVKLAKRLHRYYVDRIGSDAVYLVCGENSESFEAQAFIKAINDRLPALRVFIYTASLGTGVDITCPVRAVCGVFGRKPLDATEIHQMIGRCRNPSETHVFIKDTEGDATTDASAIYDTYIKNAIRTQKAIQISGGVVRLSDEQQRLTQLISQCEAQKNHSVNDLRGHFVALANGYAVSYAEGVANEALRDELSAVGEIVAAEQKAAVLNADPVSYEEYDQKRQQGELTPADRAGRERYKIEDTGGQTITPLLYDELHEPAERAKLIRFADVLDTDAHAQDADRAEQRDGVPLAHMRHRTMQRRLARRLLHDVFGDVIDPELELTAEQIGERMTDFLEMHAADLASFYGWRGDQSHNPVAILRWILDKRYGLKLISRQVRIGNGERVRLYALDADQLARMDYNARCRLAHLERQRADRKAESGGDLKRGDISHAYAKQGVRADGLHEPYSRKRRF